MKRYEITCPCCQKPVEGFMLFTLAGTDYLHLADGNYARTSETIMYNCHHCHYQASILKTEYKPVTDEKMAEVLSEGDTP